MAFEVGKDLFSSLLQDAFKMLAESIYYLFVGFTNACYLTLLQMMACTAVESGVINASLT